jgi:hypothetical protein
VSPRANTHATRHTPHAAGSILPVQVLLAHSREVKLDGISLGAGHLVASLRRGGLEVGGSWGQL